ncbi:hypothetical protein ASAC_1501 [Acidilobus saccharovorans 345-15]|uniref:Uncharacterized protein n=1 Tax=Acidilobus saccharovorans (strain DSM 16705 / JCM 18335 / VKM B-2471 / 345-15) TaxID=666510 RepID=D9PZB9_ACIS3|nr:hypothetical protein [Acidilobus saccharovorans]ADL19906.1 hypothetical protein ASAC_1501 [Acidilobus saccharovorans 345-15]
MSAPLSLGEEEAFLEYLDDVLHNPPPSLSAVFKDRMNEMRDLVTAYDELKSIVRGARDARELSRLLRDYHISVEDIRKRATVLRSYMAADSGRYINAACTSDLPATGVRELRGLCDVGEPTSVNDSIELVERALTIAVAVDVARGWAQEAAAFYLSSLGVRPSRGVKEAASSLAGDDFRGRLIALSRDLARAARGLCAAGDYDKSERLKGFHGPGMIVDLMLSGKLASALGDSGRFLEALAGQLKGQPRGLLDLRSPSVVEEDPVLSAALVLPALAGARVSQYWRLAYRARELGFRGRAAVALWTPPRPVTCWGVLGLASEAHRDAREGVFVDVRDERAAVDVAFSAYAALSEAFAALSGMAASYRRASEVATALGLPPPPGPPPDLRGAELTPQLLKEVADYANSAEAYMAKVRSLSPEVSPDLVLNVSGLQVREGWPVVEVCLPNGQCMKEPPIAVLVAASLRYNDTVGEVVRRASEALPLEGPSDGSLPSAAARVLRDIADMAAAGALKAPPQGESEGSRTARSTGRKARGSRRARPTETSVPPQTASTEAAQATAPTSVAFAYADRARKVNKGILVLLWPLLLTSFFTAFVMPKLWFLFIMSLIMIIAVSKANSSIVKGHSSPSGMEQQGGYAGAGRDVLVGLFFAFITAVGVPAMNLRAVGDLIEVVLFIIMILLLASYAALRSAASKLR